ncbi:MAG: XTP/dITP diphosphatase [Acidobacteria bacterium]|nr:XTP/dITP diphosphatase [Acidobacteriota bacterium]
MQNNLSILIATHNEGKLREFQSLLAESSYRLHSLKDFPSVAEVEETGDTFAANAMLKAIGYAAQTGLLTLADDSGLEVVALGGAPGVYSARYAGAEATDAERTVKLLSELSGTPDEERRARFVCVIALADASGTQIETFTGACEGSIAREPRGTHGFGYDPIFIPDGYQETFGQLPTAVKQKISHRARALTKAQAFLLRHFPSNA